MLQKRREHDGVDVEGRLQASDGLEAKGALGLSCIICQLRGEGPDEGETWRRGAGLLQLHFVLQKTHMMLLM